MQAALARRGIRVDQGWVDAAARAGCTTEEQLFVQFLAHDLRKAAATAATLPRPLGDTLGGAWVLQVEAVADVGEPAPRHAKTIKALLTDGVRDVGAVCQGWVDRLELGAKIFVKDAPVQRGVVLLRPDNCRVLDCLGHVKAEALAARAAAAAAPPAAAPAAPPPRAAGAARGAGAAPAGAARAAGAAPPAPRPPVPARALPQPPPRAAAAATTAAATAAAAAPKAARPKPAIRPPSPKRQRSFGELLTPPRSPR